jgi:hypothetical protein
MNSLNCQLNNKVKMKTAFDSINDLEDSQFRLNELPTQEQSKNENEWKDNVGPRKPRKVAGVN